MGNLTENINESAFADALADDPQNPHLYITGKTRSGKSNLLFFRIMADIIRGRGICVIDAKSGLVNQIRQWIPASLAHRIVYLGPNNEIPLDFMSYGGFTQREREVERQKLVAEIRFLFLKTSNTDSMPIIRSNTNWILNTLLDYNDNPATPPNKRATFMDIFYFLTNKLRQKEIIAGVKNNQLRTHWQNPDSIPSGKDLHHLTTRMDDFVTSDSLHRIFDCPEPKLNVSQAILEHKVILVDLGQLTDTQMIYATLLVSQIRQHFYRYMNLEKERQTHFWLYADEFQTFQTSDFADMLSRAGGLGLHITLSNQYPHQIESTTWEAAFKNINNYYLFQIDPDDSARFRPYFPTPEPKPDTSRLHAKRKDLIRRWESLEDKRMEILLAHQPNEYQSVEERFGAAEAASVQRQALRLAEERDEIKRQVEDELDYQILVADAMDGVADFQKELIHMPVGKCIYLSMNKKICKIIDTPPPRDEHNPHNNAALIDQVTLHQFSAEPMDRTCYNEPIHVHTDPTDEDFKEPKSTVSSHRKKKGRS